MRVGVLPDAILLQLFEQGCDPNQGVLVKLLFEGASPLVQLEGLHERQGVHHFYHGSDPSNWQVNVHSYSQIRFLGLYEGIDLILRADRNELEYDLVVQPGADLSQVVVRCQGAESIRVDSEDGVTLDTAVGQLQHPVGRSWQVSDSNTHNEVRLRYRRIDRERFGFEVLERDPSLLLVIDPELLWSTYLGGVGGGATIGDRARAVALDGNGNVTVVGRTEGGLEGGGFPMTPGTYQSPGLPLFEDVFVTRFRQSDGEMVYSSVIGGSSHLDDARAVAVDSSGRATVVGDTFSFDFPTTPGAFDEVKTAVNDSAFVLRLSADGSSLEYSTFLEGSAVGGSQGRAIEVTDSGSAIVGGYTSARDFPTTPGSYSTSHGGSSDGFITRLNSTGSSLEWSTFLGGAGNDLLFALAMDAQETVTATGHTTSSDFPTTPGAFDTGFPSGGEAFVTRLEANGGALIWSTFLGGGQYDAGTTVALDRSGDALVGGVTYSLNFPTTSGAFQESFPQGAPFSGFVTRLNALGTNLVFSTYLGGSSTQSLDVLVADVSGVVTAVGDTESLDFPVTPGAYRENGFTVDLYVSRIDPTGSRLFYSSYVGGTGQEEGHGLAMNAAGRVTMVGYNVGGGYPTTEGAFRPNSNGGFEAIVTTMDLTLQGIQLLGQSTPACLGPLSMNATEKPVAGSSSFGFYCSGVPPLTEGLFVLKPPNTFLDDSGSSNLVIGFASLASHVRSDAQGYVETLLPLPLGTAGYRFSARYLFKGTAACPATGPWSSSNRVRVTVQ